MRVPMHLVDQLLEEERQRGREARVVLAQQIGRLKEELDAERGASRVDMEEKLTVVMRIVIVIVMVDCDRGCSQDRSSCRTGKPSGLTFVRIVVGERGPGE